MGLTQVTEFQPIVCESNRYEHFDEYEYLDEKTFRELERFIKDYSANIGDAEASDFLKIGFKKHVGEIITSVNYVGLIELKSGHKIQILPKMDLGGDLRENKRVFLKMLCAMKDFPAKEINNAGQSAADMNLYEIFIRMYVNEVRHLVKHGLKSEYIREEDNLNYYKGKLLINEHIKRNPVHAERFYVSYDEYILNRPENKIIKSTLLKLQTITDSSRTSKEINQLLTAFEFVDTSKNHLKDFSKVKIDRNTKDYEMIMIWSRVFLINKSFTTFSGDNNARALLFQMDKVFEAYVAKELKRYVPDGWKISVQDRGYYLFDEPSIFEIRPDIVIKTNNDIKVILDTKWKRLIPNEKANYGISQSDMYQMYAYSKKYQTSEIWVLYPYNSEMEDYQNLSFLTNRESINTNVHVFFVKVNNIKENLEELIERITSYAKS